MTTLIDNIDEEVSESLLNQRGFTVENIVGTLDLGQEFDLVYMSTYLDNTSYEPETSPFLVYRPQPEQGTILLPTNGKVSLVGCKSKDNIIQLGNRLINELSQLVTEELPSPKEIEVQNIVVQGNIQHELELPPIVVLLGTEQAEYEPEQFPGVIYRPTDGTTVLIFNSGKFMVNGATSYSQALSAADRLIEKFREAGVPMGI